MPSLSTDLSVEQGSTFVLEFQVFDEELNPLEFLSSSINQFGTKVYSLSDYRARMKIRRSKYTNSVIYTCGTTSNFVTQPGSTLGFVTDGIYFVGGSTGFMRVVMTADTTDSFKAGRHFYDIELVQSVTGGNIVNKILSGKVEIEAESTR
jgi:hypothetical protein